MWSGQELLHPKATDKTKAPLSQAGPRFYQGALHDVDANLLIYFELSLESLDSSTVMTPSLPTFFIAWAMNSADKI